MTTSGAASSFPRQNARTQRFSLGRPRTVTVSPDGRRVAFIRSASGDDRAGRLWVLDLPEGTEREVADPTALLGAGDEQLSAEERARRERMREAAGGIVGYGTDRAVEQACFTLSGRLFVAGLRDGTVRELPAQGPVVDPRLDPTGRTVAYAAAGGLRVTAVDGSGDRLLMAADGPGVTVGLADFVAAEEHDRSRGFWWSPAGDRLLVERFDDSAVDTWHVSDPAHPAQPPVEQRYPAAGTANAEVTLWLVALDGAATQVRWDREAFEYVTAVHWSERGLPLVQVLDRRQARAQVLAVDPGTGATTLLREQSDSAWVDVVPGVPCWGPSGRLLTVEPVGDRYALCEEGTAVTPEGLQVRAVLDVGSDVLLSGSPGPSEEHVWRWTGAATEPVTDQPGVHGAARGGPTLVTVSATLATPLPTTTVRSGDSRWSLVSHAETPLLTPHVRLLPAGADDLRVAVVLPTGWQEGGEPLPVLLDPYGGPHAARVLQAQGAFRESQWFADQGFAVVVVDGRGTPGSPGWERAVRLDVADVVLADQVAGLEQAAAAVPGLDLDRVGIRGWSFGGFLAAMAVIRRPDVFHAAVAGAPVTDWRLYDTGYTERYLGLPQEHPEAYDHCSLLDDAATLSRPLMLVHGFADDNVFVANTLQLSAVLTAAGRPHTLLPLSGVTHMATQEEVAENLLLLQVEFLRQALGLASG